MAANPRPWSAAHTVWPCGSRTVDFGVTNTRAFMGTPIIACRAACHEPGEIDGCVLVGQALPVTSKTALSTRSVSQSNRSAFIGVHRRLNLSAALTRKLSKTIHQPPINADQRRFLAGTAGLALSSVPVSLTVE